MANDISINVSSSNIDEGMSRAVRLVLSALNEGAKAGVAAAASEVTDLLKHYILDQLGSWPPHSEWSLRTKTTNLQLIESGALVESIAPSFSRGGLSASVAPRGVVYAMAQEHGRDEITTSSGMVIPAMPPRPYIKPVSKLARPLVLRIIRAYMLSALKGLKSPHAVAVSEAVGGLFKRSLAQYSSSRTAAGKYRARRLERIREIGYKGRKFADRLERQRITVPKAEQLDMRRRAYESLGITPRERAVKEIIASKVAERTPVRVGPDNFAKKITMLAERQVELRQQISEKGVFSELRKAPSISKTDWGRRTRIEKYEYVISQMREGGSREGFAERVRSVAEMRISERMSANIPKRPGRINID